MNYNAHITLSGDGANSEFGKGVAYGKGRVRHLRQMGKTSATETARFGDVTVRVKLVGAQNFVHVSVDGGRGYLVFPRSLTHPNGITQIGTPPAPVPPTAIVRSVKKDESGKVVLKIKENRLVDVCPIDWRSADGKEIVTFGSGYRYGRLDATYARGDPFHAEATRFFCRNGKKIDVNFFVSGVCKKSTGFICANSKNISPTSGPTSVSFHHYKGAQVIADFLGHISVGQDESLPFFWHFNSRGDECVSLAVRNTIPASLMPSVVKEHEEFRLVVAKFKTEADGSISFSYSFVGGWIKNGVLRETKLEDGIDEVLANSNTEELVQHKFIKRSDRIEKVSRFVFGADFDDKSVPQMLYAESTGVSQFGSSGESKGVTSFSERTVTLRRQEWGLDFAAFSPLHWTLYTQGNYTATDLPNRIFDIYEDFLIREPTSKTIESNRIDWWYAKTIIKIIHGTKVIAEGRIVEDVTEDSSHLVPRFEVLEQDYICAFQPYMQPCESWHKIKYISRGLSPSWNSKTTFKHDTDFVAIEDIDARRGAYIGTRFLVVGDEIKMQETSRPFDESPSSSNPTTLSELITPPAVRKISGAFALGGDIKYIDAGVMREFDSTKTANFYGRPHLYCGQPMLRDFGGKRGAFKWRDDSAIYYINAKEIANYHRLTKNINGQYVWPSIFPVFGEGRDVNKKSMVVAAVKVGNNSAAFEDVNSQFSIGAEDEFGIPPIFVF